METEQKTVPFTLTELKARDEGGWQVSGYGSTWGGEPDSYGDIVARGAFTDSIAKRSPKFFYQHYEPIGATLKIEEDDKGLFGTWSIIDTTTGSDAHKLAKAGVIDCLSIGFRTVEADFREDGIRVLRKVDLLEVSLVPFPANENALITQVKADVPFDVLTGRVGQAMKILDEQAEALVARRSADGRELSARHVEAVKAALTTAEALVERLHLIASSRTEAKAAAGFRPSLALLELRLLRHGVRVERTVA